MARHLRNQRIVSGVLFWEPTDLDDEVPVDVRSSRGPNSKWPKSQLHDVRPLKPAGPTQRSPALQPGQNEEGLGSTYAYYASGPHAKPARVKTLREALKVFPRVPVDPQPPTIPEAPRDLLCLPILSVNVDVTVDGTVAFTDLTQSFRNPSNLVIPEARHSFPLYDGAVVTSFECTIGDTRFLRGVVEPKKKAREEFEKAMRSEKRRAAALLEELTPEIFETALGNIPPDTTVTVKLRYVHELKAVVMKHEKAEGLAITIPTSVAPRYGGSAGLISSPGMAEASLKIWIRVVDNGAINVDGCRAESGHDVFYQGTEPVPTPVVVGGLAELANLPAPHVAETPKTQFVWHYASGSTVLRKDFVFVIQMRHEQRLRSRAVLEPADRTGHAALMVSLRPNDLFASAVRPQSFAGELLFLLDRSSSMGWTDQGAKTNTLKIDTLRDAMMLALAGLPDTCAFNLVSFGSTVRGMWPESKAARDADNMKHARKYVSSVAADMGGTAVWAALASAVRTRLRSRPSTQVILITDGEVDSEPQDRILKFVWETRRELGDKIRFFTLGIGDNVSHRVMESIAELGGGYCDVVDVVQRPRWEDRLNRMLRSAMEPDSWSCDIALGPGYQRQSLTTARFAQGSPGGEGLGQQPYSAYFQAPCPVPPLHPYTYKSVFFLLDLRGGRNPPAGVTITTTTPGAKKQQYNLEVEPAGLNARTVHHLAAKAMLLSLEDEVNRGAEETDDVRANAEHLGKEYAIASKWTSFVAVEDDDDDAAAPELGVHVDVYKTVAEELTADELLTLERDDASDDNDFNDADGDDSDDSDCMGLVDAAEDDSDDMEGAYQIPPEQSPLRAVRDPPEEIPEKEVDMSCQPTELISTSPARPPGPQPLRNITQDEPRRQAQEDPFEQQPAAPKPFSTFSSSPSGQAPPTGPDSAASVSPDADDLMAGSDLPDVAASPGYALAPPAPEVESLPASLIDGDTFSDTDGSTGSDDSDAAAAADQPVAEAGTDITWRSAVKYQRGGLFVLDEVLRANLRVHFCAVAAPRLADRLRELIAGSQGPVVMDDVLAAVVDTLMMMQYFETHLPGERDSWHLLMDKAERSVLLRLGFGEDQDEVLMPLYEMLALSIAHVHFDEAVDGASTERKSGGGEICSARPAVMKTCQVCDKDFDADAWPESGNRSFVCLSDDCYGRGAFDTWDSFWDHQVKSGHKFCPENGFGENGEFD